MHAKFLRPQKITSPCQYVLIFNGSSGNSSDWSYKLNSVDQGFVIAALVGRWQGGLSEDSEGVTGNTQHGHIIRSFDDALVGKPEELLFWQNFLDTANWQRSSWKCHIWMSKGCMPRVEARAGLLLWPVQLWSREIRRRTKSVGAFSDGQSALMLVCARLRHIEESDRGQKTYLNMQHLEELLPSES